MMMKSDRQSRNFKRAEIAWSPERPVVSDAIPLTPTALRVQTHRPMKVIVGTVLAAAGLSALVVFVDPLTSAESPSNPPEMLADPIAITPQTTASLPLPVPAEPIPMPQTQPVAAVLPGSHGVEPTAAPEPQGVTPPSTTVASDRVPVRPNPFADDHPTDGLPEPKPAMQRPLAVEDTSVYLQKGEEKVEAGDLAAARLYFDRVARSGDPRGAVAMARTFDPDVIAKLPVIGAEADAEAARSWYERAKSLQAAL
jgi:hypothetical protein